MLLPTCPLLHLVKSPWERALGNTPKPGAEENMTKPPAAGPQEHSQLFKHFQGLTGRTDTTALPNALSVYGWQGGEGCTVHEANSGPALFCPPWPHLAPPFLSAGTEG